MPLFKATQLLGKPVLAGSKNNQTDKFQHFIVHPDNGRILGGISKSGAFLIKQIEKKGSKLVMTTSPIDSASQGEVADSLREKMFVIKSKVETESGHYLGRVTDFEFDDVSWQIERIFVSDRVLFRALTTQLQIPRDDILCISKGSIIVRDGLVKRGAVAGAEGESEYVGIGSGATLLEK